MLAGRSSRVACVSKTEHGRKGRGVTMAIEKCIDEFEVDEIIFEEGSTGRELFVVLDAGSTSPRSTAPARR
jgi:hypothetical protein